MPHLRLMWRDHIAFLQETISSSFSSHSPSDARLVCSDGSLSVNRLVLALLHPELALCPRLALEQVLHPGPGPFPSFCSIQLLSRTWSCSFLM